MFKITNFLLIVLLLAYSNQIPHNSGLSLLESKQVTLQIPTDFTALVQTKTYFCVYWKIICEDNMRDCLSITICDFKDPLFNWKFIPNGDGTYNIQNKKDMLYLQSTRIGNMNFDQGVLNKNPEKFVIVPSKNFPTQTFSLRPFKNKDVCLDGETGNFKNCIEEAMTQQYFFNKDVGEEVIIQNTFYNFRYNNNYFTNEKRCLRPSGRSNNFCTTSGPDAALKFVATDDDSYLIISGNGQAISVNSRSKLNFNVLYQVPDPKNPLQKFRIIRDPIYPEVVYIRNQETNNCIQVSSLSTEMCTFVRDENKQLIQLTPGCTGKIVNEGIWYFLQSVKDPENCMFFDKNQNTINNLFCKYQDDFLFKFEWDEEYQSYYIYNKSQGDKNVLTFDRDYNGYWNYKINFQPKEGKGSLFQRFNLSDRILSELMGFYIYLQNSQAENRIDPMRTLNPTDPLRAITPDFIYPEKELLSNVAELTTEYYGVPPEKVSTCPGYQKLHNIQ